MAAFAKSWRHEESPETGGFFLDATGAIALIIFNSRKY